MSTRTTSSAPLNEIARSRPYSRIASARMSRGSRPAYSAAVAGRVLGSSAIGSPGMSAARVGRAGTPVSCLPAYGWIGNHDAGGGAPGHTDRRQHAGLVPAGALRTRYGAAGAAPTGVSAPLAGETSTATPARARRGRDS